MCVCVYVCVCVNYNRIISLYTYSYFRKGYHSQLPILEPKGTLGTVIMSDVPAKDVTLLPWQYLMNLHSIFCKIDANSNKLSVLLEPHSSFRLQYRLLTMTTFFEIAVYLKVLDHKA